MTIEDPTVYLFCGDVVDAQKPAVGCKERSVYYSFQANAPTTLVFFASKGVAYYYCIKWRLIPHQPFADK